MIFSVFNDNARCWEYFEAPGTSATYGARGTKYRPLNGRPSGPPRGLSGPSDIGPIGFTPEALAMPLPSNARQVGRGSVARGVVAVQRHHEVGGTVGAFVNIEGRGLSGFGAAEDQPPPPAVVVDVPGISLSKVVFAACVASVVGVVVQKLLK